MARMALHGAPWPRHDMAPHAPAFTTHPRMVCTQAAQAKRDNDAMKRAIVQYDEALEAYMPGVPALAAHHQPARVPAGLCRA